MTTQILALTGLNQGVGLLQKTQSFTVSGETVLTQAIDLSAGRDQPDKIKVIQVIEGKSNQIERTITKAMTAEFRDCDCCIGFNNPSTKRIPRNQECPVCHTCEKDEEEKKFGTVDQLVIGSLILGMLLPHGGK